MLMLQLFMRLVRRCRLAFLCLIWKIRAALKRGGAAPDAIDITIRKTTSLSFSDRRYNPVIPPNFVRKPSLILAGHPSNIEFVPNGWKQYVHPEGKPYYHRAARRLVTNSNICRDDIRSKVDAACDRIMSDARKLKGMNLATTEIFIELENPDDILRHYLVDHQAHTEFWLTDDQSDSDDLRFNDVYSEAHMAVQREEHYWTHVEFFSMHVPYPIEAEEELYSVLGYAGLDGATSPTSTSAYSPKECEKFIRCLDTFKCRDGVRLWALARIWKEIVKNRFLNLHGQPFARLHRLASLGPETTLPLPVLPKLVLGAMLFNVHQGHILSLEKIYVDKIVCMQHWRSLIEDRLREWNSVTIIATVLWTVDVGLLQVLVGLTSPLMTLARCLVVSSTFCAMTSMLLSLLHDRQHRGLVREVDDAEKYLRQHWNNKRGFLYLAISHSFPYVLLLWAMLLSAAASLIFGLDAGGMVMVSGFLLLVFSVIATALVTWNMETGDLTQMVGNWKAWYLDLLHNGILQLGQRQTSAPSVIAAANESGSQSDA